MVVRERKRLARLAEMMQAMEEELAAKNKDS